MTTTAARDYHPWLTYIDAVREAKCRGDRNVGTEHLLMALLAERECAAALGRDVHAVRAALAAMDRDALSVVGVEVTSEIPEPEPVAGLGGLRDPASGHRPAKPSLRAVMQGRLRLTPSAKRVLRGSSKEMRGIRGHHLGPQHVLDTLLDLRPPDPAAELISALGVDIGEVRARLRNP